MDTRTVTHHGRTTAYRHVDRGGDAPGLCCVHGSGGDHTVFRGQFRLAGECPVAALDLSGHGDSDDVDAEPGYETLAAYADDVVAVCEETDASVLVGSSLGGLVALQVALERDVALDGLVLAGTGARLPVLADLLTWLSEDFDSAVAFLHEPDHLFHDVDDDTLDASRAAMRATGQAVTERDFRTAHAVDFRDRLADVTPPAVAVVGEYDRLTPRRYHERLSVEMPDCTLAVVEDAAHLAMLERPRAFNAVVTDFLDRRTQ